MSYSINKFDGTFLVTVEDGTVNTDVTDISLVGRGVVSYGEATAENLVHMMEHFANITAPTKPLTGQMWYDTSSGVLNVWTGTIWNPIVTGGGDFVQKTGDTMTGDLTITNTNARLTLDGTGNAQIDMGRTDGTSSASWIDFHTGSLVTSYDSRIEASGGSGTVGGGTLSLRAATIELDASSVIAGNSVRISDVQNPVLPQDAATKGYVDSVAGTGTGNSAISAGTVFASAGVMSGPFLECNGAAVDRTIYSDLFAAIGETYGAGDGSTTFNLPNLQGRFVVGDGDSLTTGSTSLAQGDIGGTAEHQLTESEMPSHRHRLPNGANDAQAGGNDSNIPGDPGSLVYYSNFTGGDQPHQNMPPYLTLKWYVCTENVGGSVAPNPSVAGEIKMFGGSTEPPGWLFCNGSAVSRTVYSLLFTAIGTTFGAGDGSTTFNLPNFGGRMPIGVGASAGLTTRTLGQTGGAETHQLTDAEMPSHTHNITNRRTSVNNTGSSPAGTSGSGISNATTSSAGSDQPHNNMSPFLGINFIIYTGA